jgi:hypothetical protein
MTRSAAKVTNRITSPRIARNYYGSDVADVKWFTMPNGGVGISVAEP